MGHGRRMNGRTALVVLFLVVGGLTLAGTGLLPAARAVPRGRQLVGRRRARSSSWPSRWPRDRSRSRPRSSTSPPGYAYGFWPAMAAADARLGRLVPARLLARVQVRRPDREPAGRARGARAAARLGGRRAGARPARRALHPGRADQPRLLRGRPGADAAGRFTWTTAAGLTPQFGLPIYAGSQARDVALTDPRYGARRWRGSS